MFLVPPVTPGKLLRWLWLLDFHHLTALTANPNPHQRRRPSSTGIVRIPSRSLERPRRRRIPLRLPALARGSGVRRLYSRTNSTLKAVTRPAAQRLLHRQRRRRIRAKCYTDNPAPIRPPRGVPDTTETQCLRPRRACGFFQVRFNEAKRAQSAFPAKLSRRRPKLCAGYILSCMAITPALRKYCHYGSFTDPVHSWRQRGLCLLIVAFISDAGMRCDAGMEERLRTSPPVRYII